MEYRQERAEFVTSYAINQYQKEFRTLDKNLETQRNVLKNVNTIAEVYKPQRYYKRKSAPPEDIQTRVQITLLEYGLRGDVKRSSLEESEEETLESQQLEEVLINSY